MAGANYAQIHDPERREHYVYRLIGKRGRVLYIGCSMNLKIRLREHRYNGNFGHLFTTVETEGPFNYTEARAREAAAIRAEQPPFNIEHTTRERRGHAGWRIAQIEREAVRARTAERERAWRQSRKQESA